MVRMAAYNDGEMWCARGKDGGYMASIEIRPRGPTKLSELRSLVVRMVAGRSATKSP